MIWGNLTTLGNRLFGGNTWGTGIEEDVSNLVTASREENGTPDEIASRVEGEKSRALVFRAREDALRGEIEKSRERGGAVAEKANLFRDKMLASRTAIDIMQKDRVENVRVNEAWPETRKAIYLKTADLAARYAEKGLTPEGNMYAPSGSPLASPLLAEDRLAADGSPIATESTRNLALVLGATVLLAFLVVRM